MEYLSGNIFVRQCGVMKAGEVVVGHRHNFDHTTFCRAGALRIELVQEGGPEMTDDEALAAGVARRFILRASDPINWMLIRAGRYHRITALEDGSIYQCIYAHRAPGALAENESITRVDPDGSEWVRVNPDIVQDSARWAQAYR